MDMETTTDVVIEQPRRVSLHWVLAASLFCLAAVVGTTLLVVGHGPQRCQEDPMFYLKGTQADCTVPGEYRGGGSPP